MIVNTMSTDQIIEEGSRIRYDLFSKLCQVQEGHPGSILSIFDITNALYLSGAIFLEKGAPNNDTFIMSKGHAAAVQYPFLVRKEIIEKKDWENWGKGDSILRVFGNTQIPGIDVTSGSLGHGIGIATGIALANRANNIKAKVYVVISEGELYEGSTWEALLFLAHQRLAEVKIIVDVNRNMILGRPDDLLNLEPMEDKFSAFNFECVRIAGHDYEAILGGIDFLLNSVETPPVLIADTVKGKGVSFMEDTAQSHYWGQLSEDEMQKMLEDLAP